MTAEAWMITRWDRNVDHIDYRLDEHEGVYLDRELAEARVAELNETERIKAEERVEQEYRTAHGAWRMQKAEHGILVRYGFRQGPFLLAEPQRYALTRTIDEYRLSDPLDLYIREKV